MNNNFSQTISKYPFRVTRVTRVTILKTVISVITDLRAKKNDDFLKGNVKSSNQIYVSTSRCPIMLGRSYVQ